MIQLGNQKEINEIRKGIKDNIVGGYTNKEIAKALSAEEFDNNYPSDRYERYSEDAIAKFKEDFEKAEDGTEDLLKENLKDLKAIPVFEENQLYNIFVREIPEA